MSVTYEGNQMVTVTEQIWKDYHAKLHNFIQNRIGDESLADDILQEVFLKIYSKIDTLKDDSKIQNWIYQITRNAIIDQYRAHKKTEELPDSLAISETDSSDESRQEIASCILPMLKSLPEHYRETLMLSEIDGLKQKNVATKQGLSLPGVKKRIQRGRTMMKDMLLECCRFEFDRQGKIIDYDSKKSSCDQC